MNSWKRWRRRIEETAELARAKGLTPYRDLELEIGVGMLEDALQELARRVGPLPDDYLALLRESRSVVFSYQAAAELTSGTVDFCGPREAAWDARYLEWCGAIAEEFGYFDPGSQGQDCTVFLHTVDDDFVAFDMRDHCRGEVFFAAHDDHESRPRIAGSFCEFMDKWSELHFPDLEALLELFWDREKGCIDTEGRAAQEWKSWLRDS